MKTPKIAKAMEHLDERLIAEAADERAQVKKKPWLKWGALAASITAVAVCAALLLPMAFDSEEEGIVVPRPNAGYYKDMATENSAIVWPWEYKTVAEKYLTLNYGSKEFSSRGRSISSALVGEKIGVGEASGYDHYTEKVYTESFEVYEIKSVSSAYLVAVKMDGDYYVFDDHAEHAPDRFGALLDAYSLSEIVKLEKFSLGEQYFSLDSDERVWEILNSCRDAQAVSKAWDAQISETGESIHFTLTSEQLGVYKVVFRIVEGGYLWTNAFDYAYEYHIGAQKAREIIDYVKSHSKQIESEPYQYAVYGIITEINDGYFLIDDTEACADAKNGKVYKVISDDVRISRHFDFEKIGVGDMVALYYDGTVKNGNVIEEAIGMSKAFMFGTDVLIPE